jgi:hypothetical protein
VWLVVIERRSEESRAPKGRATAAVAASDTPNRPPARANPTIAFSSTPPFSRRCLATRSIDRSIEVGKKAQLAVEGAFAAAVKRHVAAAS